jgi:hypothetical protein
MKNKPGFKTLENNINSLKAIAQILSKGTSSLKLFDPQVARSSWDWKDSLSGKPIPSDFFSRKLSFKANDFRVTIRVNDEYLVIDVVGAFGSSVICSFENHNVHASLRKLGSASLCRAFGCKVYIGSIPNTDNTISFLNDPSFQLCVKDLQLSKKESLHIGNGCASLYIQRFVCDDVLKTLDILYQILALLPSAEEETINYRDLPEEFHKLIPWIKRWGICDDNERSDKIGKASSKVLAKLVDTVEPEFSIINTYLDSFTNKPLPEQAILLGALAESASEAKILLKRRITEKENAQPAAQPDRPRR